MMELIYPLNLDALQGLLDTQKEAGIQTYLLLDGAANPRILGAVRRSGLPWCSVFTQSDDGPEALMGVSPLLLACPPGRAERVRKLLERFAALPFASVWHTPETLVQLAARLWPWCVVEADDSLFNLRYPDTRRLPDLDRILTEPQRAQFFGPARACLVPDRLGRDWQALTLPIQPAPPAEKVVFDTAQTLALIRAAEADEIIHQLHFYGRIQAAVLADIHPTAETALQDADAQGVEDPRQRMAHCLLAIDALT